MVVMIELPGLPPPEETEACKQCGTEEPVADWEARGGLCAACYWVPARCICGALHPDGVAWPLCPKCHYPMCPDCEEDYYRSNAGNCRTCRFEVT